MYRNEANAEYIDADGDHTVEFFLKTEQDAVLSFYGDMISSWMFMLGKNWMQDRIPDHIYECLDGGWE